MGRHNQAAVEFAARIKALGFRAFIAKGGEGDYGFVTDETGSRVLSFAFSIGDGLSGNYGPPSRESGTGWKMDELPFDLRTVDDVRRALYAHPPAFCGKGWKHMTTLAQHIAMYGSSSNYAEYGLPIKPVRMWVETLDHFDPLYGAFAIWGQYPNGDRDLITHCQTIEEANAYIAAK